MSTKIISELSRHRPLLYFDDGLIVSCGRHLFFTNLTLDSSDYIASIPSNSALEFRSRHLNRMKRAFAGPAASLGNGCEFVVCWGGAIYLINATTGDVQKEHAFSKGDRSLRIQRLDVNGFENTLYYGEYFSNRKCAPASIWRRDGGVWGKVFTYSPGAINHIHGFHADRSRDCVYVLTGDYDHAACIWKAEDDFRSVSPWIRQGQLSRACWMSSFENRLFYATDTHLEPNYFCEVVDADACVAEVSRRFPIVGSSIYSCENRGVLCYSTAVEPPPPTGSKLSAIITRRRGLGILSDRSCIYAGDPVTGFQLVLQAEKDRWPSRLLGFGAFCFPVGECPDPSIIHAYGNGVKGYDDVLLSLDIREARS